MSDNMNNSIRIYTSSSPVSATVSSIGANDALELMNNKSKYYAELALRYKNESKEILDRVISYAEQNSDVTMEDVNRLKVQLEYKISEKQPIGEYVESSDLATVATTGAYSDLTGTPTIPTVNDATLTIQKNGTTVNTFTANASSNVTANITVPTATSDLTNDSGFIDSSSLQDVICVVNEYQSGSVYVRVWSNGLIEQWMHGYTQSSAGTHSFTFPVTFSAAPLLITNYYLASTATTGITIRNAGYDRSAFGFTSYFAANGYLDYYARGY